eukprot:2818804-Amphidinium_carterae.1
MNFGAAKVRDTQTTWTNSVIVVFDLDCGAESRCWGWASNDSHELWVATSVFCQDKYARDAAREVRPARVDIALLVKTL